MKQLKNGILGLIIGDALGVPVEFQTRKELDNNPVIDLRGHGTYKQAKGTWSDDSSLTLCLCEGLTKEYSLVEISNSFIAWRYKSRWTPHGKVFDIGLQTNKAIYRLRTLINAVKYEELSDLNANAAVTHGHLRSALSCLIYMIMIDEIYDCKNKNEVYENTCRRFVFHQVNGVFAPAGHSGLCPL